LKKSWLSREILFVGLFGVGWLAGFVLPETRWVTSLLGIGLIYSMAKVYQLRPMPAWNTWRTMAGFFIASILLGQLLIMNFLQVARWGIVAVLLALELAMMLSVKPKTEGSVIRLQVGLIACAIVGTVIMSIVPNPLGMWISLPIFLIVLVEEIIGRWLFYEALKERPI
jgi:DMSO reductase anchor subunit